MLRHWIAAASMLISATAASAQQTPNWTGFYVGGHIAGSRDRIHAADTLLINQISGLFVTGRGIVIVPGTTRPLDASDHKTNFDWGGQIGYQWQTGHFVLGLEGDFDPSHRHATVSQAQSLPPTALTPSTQIASSREVLINQSWSIRARAGYAFGRTLVYATGGYANTRLRVFGVDSFTNPGGPAASCSPAPCQANLGPEGPNINDQGTNRASRGGWTGGMGVDQQLTRHISVGLEYRHADFGAHDLTFTSSVISFTGPFTHGDNGGTGSHGTVASAASRVSLTSDSIGLRANFRF